MVTFLIVFVLVLVAVDLLVRFVVEPLMLASDKKKKIAKSYTTKFDPLVKLATETMYDGGKPHKEDGSEDNPDVEKDINKK